MLSVATKLTTSFGSRIGVGVVSLASMFAVTATPRQADAMVADDGSGGGGYYPPPSTAVVA